MFDSIRTRLTLWYVGILAAFIIAFSLIIYYALMDRLERDLDQRLREMSASFKSAAAAEERDQNEESSGDHSVSAIRESSEEMRLKDFPFIVYGKDGAVIATTADFEYELAGRNESFGN